jgi:hypothetical protein
LLIHTATLSGTVEAFDRIAYTAALAALLGVSTSAISLSVTAASVTVTSSIRAANNAAAATMLTTLRTASISPSALTAALGNIVTVEATTPPTVTERILLAPSPPPPSPPPPSPPPQPPLPPQAPPPPDQCFVSPTHRYNISASPGCALAASALAGAEGTSVCAAIALAAIEHSTLCQDSPLCKEVGFISRDDINLLYAANLADLVLEFFSTAALVLLAFPKTLGGARTGGPMLLVMLVADVALEFVVINTANRILPIITVLKDSDCLNPLRADGKTEQATLVKLEEDLKAVATLGYTELAAAAVASAGDLKDMWDVYHRKEMGGSIQRMIFLFLPAVMDVLLAALDFFIFTVSAQADNEAIRESIVNRGSMWCVTITDECVTIAENEATRLGIDRPVYNGHTGLWIGFVSAVPAISVLYFMYIFCVRERAPETNPSHRGSWSNSRRRIERENEQLRRELELARMRNQQQHTADAI